MALLADMADELLEAAAADLDPGRAPTRCYVSGGPMFAHDCHQLVVHLVSLETTKLDVAGAAHTAPYPTKFGPTLTVVTFQVTLVLDCYPIPGTNQAKGTPDLPSSEDTTAAAALVLDDSWAIYRGVLARVADGTLWADLVDDVACQGIELGPLDPFGPEGRTFGAVFAVRTKL